jgi:hypothetical protein
VVGLAIILLTVPAALAGAVLFWKRGARRVGTPPQRATYETLHTAGSASKALRNGLTSSSAVKAAPADTAFLVITLEHKVAAGMIQSVDGSHGTGLAALSTTLNFALNQRDRAISDIVAYAPPAPPADDRAIPGARASGDGPVASTFETVMPDAVGQLEDELQAIDGLKSDATDLTAGGRRLLSAATTHIAKTRGVINRTWPPIPVED